MVRQLGKLGYEGLPPYRYWFSKLKNAFVLSPEEIEDCQHIFQERGMQTFADWLRYYNNLDVGPFLEALETMRGFYANLDIFKDAVSLPGVSLKYLYLNVNVYLKEIPCLNKVTLPYLTFCQVRWGNATHPSCTHQKERHMTC